MPEKLSIVIDADVVKAVSGLQQLKDEQALLNQEIADFNTALKKNDAAIAQKTKELNLLSRAAGVNREQISKLKVEIDQLRAKSVTLTAGLKGSRTELGAVTNQVRDYVRQANQIRSINEQASLSFKRFTSVGALAGQAMNNLRGQVVSLGTSLISGFIGGAVIGALSELVSGLNKTSKGFSDVELAALKFNAALDKVLEGADNLREGLDFVSKLQDLEFRIKFGEGFAADINQIKLSMQANEAFLRQTDEEFNKLQSNSEKAQKAFDGFRESIVRTVKSLPGFAQKAKEVIPAAQLAAQFKDLADIPKEAFDKLSAAEKAFIESARKNNETLIALGEKRAKAEEANIFAERQIRLRANVEQKRLFDKSVADFESFVSETISKGKELAKLFEDIIIVPQFSILDTKQEAFNKAKKFIDELAKGLLQIKIPPLKITPNIIIEKTEVPIIVEPVLNERVISGFLNDLSKQFTEPFKIDLTLESDLQRKTFDDLLTAFADLGDRGLRALNKISFKDFNKGLDEAKKKLKEISFKTFEEGLEAIRRVGKDASGNEVFKGLSDEVKTAAELINATLTPAFQNMFDAIIAGKNPLKAFFDSLVQSINQVIKKLIAAAVQAAILSALSGGTSKFGDVFLRIFSGRGSLAGGRDNLLGLGGAISSRSFGNTFSVVVNGQVRGSDILLAGGRALSSQQRTG